jgi:hypothetical protein
MSETVKLHLFRRHAARDSALRQLKRALMMLAGTGSRRDFLVVMAIFDQLTELRGA